MNQRNENGQRHGPWESYWSNGLLDYKAIYVNGFRNGYCESYFFDGQLHYKGIFINARRIGFFWEYVSPDDNIGKSFYL